MKIKVYRKDGSFIPRKVRVKRHKQLQHLKDILIGLLVVLVLFALFAITSYLDSIPYK